MDKVTHTDDGGAVFPQGQSRWGGMSLRDYFAGQALAGNLASFPEDANFSSEKAKQALAADSYALADAMLAERAKAQEPSNG